ncbi:MAG: hypothetical protein LBC18_03240 [Opitutaceae bacterium]|nr:hypothetical protein [Opitutaceae bacterium]
MGTLITQHIALLTYAPLQVNGAGEVVVMLRCTDRVVRLAGPRGLWESLARDILRERAPTCARAAAPADAKCKMQNGEAPPAEGSAAPVANAAPPAPLPPPPPPPGERFAGGRLRHATGTGARHLPPERLEKYRRVVAAHAAGATWEQAAFAECVNPYAVRAWLAYRGEAARAAAADAKAPVLKPSGAIL